MTSDSKGSHGLSARWAEKLKTKFCLIFANEIIDFIYVNKNENFKASSKWTLKLWLVHTFEICHFNVAILYKYKCIVLLYTVQIKKNERMTLHKVWVISTVVYSSNKKNEKMTLHKGVRDNDINICLKIKTNKILSDLTDYWVCTNRTEN